MKRAVSLAAASAFIVFFITIVVIADRGEGARWWGFIDRIPYGDKVGHLGLIGTLSLLCNLAIPSRKTAGFPGFITRTTLVLLILLTLEEIAQAFIPHRSCDVFDWLADLVGLALGQLAATMPQSVVSREV
jgi:polysaccharide biosynthesis protein VpsQ